MNIYRRNPRTREISNVVHDYASAMDFLGGRVERKLANNTMVVNMGGRIDRTRSHPIGVRLHGTMIVTYYPTGEIQLDSGGYRTATTKQRINQLLPARVSVRQVRGEWIVEGDGERLPFYDNMILKIVDETPESRM